MEKVFTGVQLEEIKSIVKDNGRDINDNSLRLMSIQDDVKEIKEDVRSMSEVIHEMQDNVNTLIELNNEQMEINRDMRATNKDIRVLLDQIISLQNEVRRDLDNWKDGDREYLKVGSM